MQQVWPAIGAIPANLAFISPQNIDNTRATAVDLGLDYLVLSDTGNVTAKAYGLVYPFTPALKEAYLSLGTDLEAYNGDSSWTLPMPATFIVGRDGVIDHALVDADYTVRMEPEEIIARLTSLAG